MAIAMNPSPEPIHLTYSAFTTNPAKSALFVRCFCTFGTLVRRTASVCEQPIDESVEHFSYSGTLFLESVRFHAKHDR